MLELEIFFIIGTLALIFFTEWFMHHGTRKHKHS